MILRQSTKHVNFWLGVQYPGAYQTYFSEGAKSFFLIFFPREMFFFWVENSHFGTPKTNFRRFQKWKAKKAKKKKKKKGPHLFLLLFILPFPIFHLPFYNFPSFLLNFHPFSLFFLSSFFFFFRYVSKNFPVRSLGGTPPPCPRLLRHWQYPHKEVSFLKCW